MAYQYLFPLAELMELTGLSDSDLATHLGLDRTHLGEIRAGKWERMDEIELRRLALWAAAHGASLPMIRPHPLWETFKDRPYYLIRPSAPPGTGAMWDASVEKELTHLLHRLGAERIPGSPKLDPLDIKLAMINNNCIFLGSPKSSLETEYALASLFRIEPQSPETRIQGSRFKFAWQNPSSLSRNSSFGYVTASASETGIHAHLPGRGTTGDGHVHRVKADYIDPRKFDNWHGTATDAGVLVVCRRPFNTEAPVTTIVIAGYTGFATLDLTKSLIEDGTALFGNKVKFDDDGPHFEPTINSGEVYVFYFESGYSKSRGGDNRKVISRSRHWYPPWPAAPKTNQRAVTL